MISLKRILIFCIGLVSALTNQVCAEETATTPHLAGKMASNVDVWQWLLALLLVLSIFLACVWLLRKTGGLLINRSQLTVIAGLSLGLREKLILIKVGEKQLLLGVSGSRIEKLLELEGEQRLFQNQENQQDPGLFKQKLMQFMQSKNHV